MYPKTAIKDVLSYEAFVGSRKGGRSDYFTNHEKYQIEPFQIFGNLY